MTRDARDRAASDGSSARPAFYARTGTRTGDLLSLLHLPYTAWHLAYVVYGAALAPVLDWTRLGWALGAFFLGTGVAAHAFDEWHDRPLRTGVRDRALLALALGGVLGALAFAAWGVALISPWALAWAAVGVLLMMAYTLEWHAALHSDLAFALTWGGFPVLVGYWAQTEGVSAAALLVAAAATLLSLAQRALSTPARHVRRTTVDARATLEHPEGAEPWDRTRLLATWETPLKWLSAATVTLAIGLLAMRA